jgi:L-asparaginase
MPAAVDALKAGRSALDVIEAGITPVEADPEVPTVGLGGAPNMLGEVECDASIVDGRTRNVGIIAGLKGYINALWLARQVMEQSPHVAIGGEGAGLFAAEMGAKGCSMLSDKAHDDYVRWFTKHVSPELDLTAPTTARTPIVRDATGFEREKDTVVYMVKDFDANIAAGGSTSGWGYKHPGRYGDTPLPGAGLWADNDGGACGCTHTGEMTARALTAKWVVDAMRRGARAEDAAHEAVAELRRIEGGYQGQVVIHAVGRNGDVHVVTTQEDPELVYWLWTEASQSIESLRPVVDRL